MTTGIEERYAGFWVRLFASIIDSLVLLALAFVLVPLGVTLSDPMEAAGWIHFLLTTAYMVILPATAWQGTVGKRVMGVKIVGPEMERIGIGRSIVRLLGQFVSAMLLMLGYLMIAFHPRKRGLHDVIAGTFVTVR